MVRGADFKSVAVQRPRGSIPPDPRAVLLSSSALAALCGWNHYLSLSPSSFLSHAGLILDGSGRGLQIRGGLATERFDSS